MNALVVLGLQCSLSLLVFFLIIQWYLKPKFSRENKFNLLALLLLINVFRYLPLSLFMPGQVSSNFPIYLKELVAYGDFISGVLALVAIIVLKSKNKAATPFIWIFSIVSAIDIVIVLFFAMSEKVYLLPLGANYFTVSVYVPMLIVIQVVIFNLLLNKKYK